MREIQRKQETEEEDSTCHMEDSRVITLNEARMAMEQLKHFARQNVAVSSKFMDLIISVNSEFLNFTRKLQMRQTTIYDFYE